MKASRQLPVLHSTYRTKYCPRFLYVQLTIISPLVLDKINVTAVFTSSSPHVVPHRARSFRSLGHPTRSL